MGERRSWRPVVVAAGAALLSGCGGSLRGTEGLSAEQSLALSCDPASAGVDPIPERTPDSASAGGEPVAAGQMTEEAAMAKRSFDGERWDAAAFHLRRVVSGETGDDEGNRQIAEYRLAICHFRLKQHRESLALFASIAGRENHLKYNETLLWLAKVATTLGPPYTNAASRLMVVHYDLDDAQRFNNPQQRELLWQIQHLLGRQWVLAGQYARAIAALEKVPPESAYHSLARDCIRLSRQRVSR